MIALPLSFHWRTLRIRVTAILPVNYYLKDGAELCTRNGQSWSERGNNGVFFSQSMLMLQTLFVPNCCCRLPAREQPNIIWTLNEKDIDFVELKSEQGCNHYENITSITTKRGYCDLLRELHWYSEDSSDISPRCYNLGDPIHRDEFIDDFRLVAAINILKWFILHIQGGNWCRECGASTFRSSAQPAKSSSSSVRTFGRTASLQPHMLPPPPPNGEGGVYSDAAISKVVQGALIACLWHIRIMKYGEWPEVDISRYFKDRDKPLDESQWCEILDFSYDLADMKCAYTLADLHEAVNLSSYGGCSTGVTVTSSLSLNSEFYNGSSSSSKGKFDATFNAQLFKVKAVLQCMSVTHPQLLNIDGCKNIWVIKAPDSSCGIGIKLHSRLDDILQSERGNRFAWFTAFSV